MLHSMQRVRCGGANPARRCIVSVHTLARSTVGAQRVPLRPVAAAVNAQSPFGSPATITRSPSPVTQSLTQPSPSPDSQLPYTQHRWMWRGHAINYATAGCGDPIILIHGFGLSSSHYRKTIKELSKTYKVYAIDLLGFGRSSKPILQYSMELWRDLVLDFMAEFTAGTQATIVGNSIGGLTCLMAAADAPADSIRGVVLLNTAGAMNNKGVLGDWRIVLAYPLFLLIDFLLSIPSVAAYLFNGLRTKENLKNALLNVYSNKSAVTDELVDLVYGPSCDSNAREVFVSVISGPPGPSVFSVMPRISAPILTLWGTEDKLTPSDGPVGRFFQELPTKRPNTQFKFLEGVGHCLHDDAPEDVHAAMLPWLASLHDGSLTACANTNSTNTSTPQPAVQVDVPISTPEPVLEPEEVNVTA